MKRKISTDFRALAQEINSRPLLTEYLTLAGDGKSFICIGSDCGNGSGEHGTGAVVKDNLLKCGKCQHSYNNIDIIANHLGITTRGKDFIDVIKFGCQLFGLPFEENRLN